MAFCTYTSIQPRDAGSGSSLGWRAISGVREGIDAPKPGARARAAMRPRHFSRRTEEAYLGLDNTL